MVQKARFTHLIRAVLARPWAINEDSYEWAAILDVLALRAAGERLSEEEISARIAAAARGPRAGAKRDGAVAVIPLYGVISPRMNLMTEMSGGTTAEGFGRAFGAALNDGEISAIVLDVDSPGGSVFGIEEAAAAVRAARGRKPIAAVAYPQAASAAYYIAAQADELVVTPSGEVGSIGVVGAHQDISELQAKLGIKTTLISAGKFKTEGNPFEPLSEEARAAWQADADRWYGMFVQAVAKGRGVSADVVRNDFGQGRQLMAKPALAAGMVDRIDTLDNTIDRALTGRIAIRPLRADASATDEGWGALDGTPAAEPGEPEETAPEAEPTTQPAAPAEAGSTTAARVRKRHDLEVLEAMGRAGLDGYLQ